MEKLTYIQKELFALQDLSYRDFQSALMPNVDKELVIGVRMPLLRKLAKTLIKENKEECQEFISNPAHKYYEENNLHSLFVGEIKDFDRCVDALEAFLPYVDNWATCDMMAPKALERNKTKLLVLVEKWLNSKHEYTVRYAIGTLMRYFLDEDFSEEYLRKVSDVKSDKYYINMMIAWYFATALAKQYESTVIYIENGALDKWVHNKTIQKAIESYRISDEKKIYLRTMRKK